MSKLAQILPKIVNLREDGPYLLGAVVAQFAGVAVGVRLMMPGLGVPLVVALLPPVAAMGVMLCCFRIVRTRMHERWEELRRNPSAFGFPDEPEDDLPFPRFHDFVRGIRYEVDALTGDTIDVFTEIPDWEMERPAYSHYGRIGVPPRPLNDERADDVRALLRLGALYVDVGESGDSVKAGFPREAEFCDEPLLRRAAEHVVRLHELTVGESR